MALRAFVKQTSTKQLCGVLSRGFAASSDPGAVKVDLTGSYDLHLFEDAPTEAWTTKEELWEYLTTTQTMRRMEITCDQEYKKRAIRGFCHLYDGQEAVATGVNAAFTVEDSWITSYRCHCTMLIRGGSVEGVLAELLGMRQGHSKGKGGSMHFYNKSHNFYGGQGIVGAQVPVGTGFAFANKYKTPPGEEMPVSIAMYGDGAANQGQIWESANMSALWKLPMIFCIENNHYGMGTSVERHSSVTDYYKMGNNIPGIKMAGYNVLAVREGMAMVKNFCGTGNGPAYVEMDTYRYHGHSMSDPGTTYRNRDEIDAVRKTKDPIEFIKQTLVELGFATEDEIKAHVKAINKDVAAALKRAQAGSPPVFEDLYEDIYLNEVPEFIRMPDVTQSIGSYDK